MPAPDEQSRNNPPASSPSADFYCPLCARPINDPLVCGDCASLICRVCGTPLEHVDELGIG